MARIIKGGLINSNSNNDEPYYQKNKKSSQDTSDEQETLLQQGIRNIAKVPSLAYKHLRSGLGIGSLIKAGAPSVDSKELEEYEQAGLLRKLFDPRLEKVHSEKIRRLALPSYEEAGEEAAAVLPKYFNESKSGDAFPEFILSELPFWAASGGFRSIPAFLEAISRSAAMAGGGVAGSHAGSAIGEQLGNKELGELLGGVGGAVLGSKAAGYLHNLPSKHIPEKIKEKKRGQFHEAQHAELIEHENKYLPELRELESQKKNAELALPKRQEAFELGKKQSLNAIKDEINTYSNKMKELDTQRTHGYTEAKKLETGAKGNASSITKGIREAEKNILHGLDNKDAQLVSHNLNGLEDIIHKNELSLESAKRFQKNFNDQLYNRDASNGFKNVMRPVINDLNEFIEKTGSPEHTQYWKSAESQTRELKKLQREHKPFLKAQEQTKRDILREKLSPIEERNFKLDEVETKKTLKAAQEQYEKTRKEIGSKKFEELSENVNPTNLTKVLEFAFDKGNLGALGLSSAFYFLLGIPVKFAGPLGTGIVKGIQKFGNEINIVRDAVKNHPEIHKDYTNLLKDWNGKPSVTFINKLNKFGEKVEDVSDENKEEKPKTSNSRIIRGGMINA